MSNRKFFCFALSTEKKKKEVFYFAEQESESESRKSPQHGNEKRRGSVTGNANAHVVFMWKYGKEIDTERE